MKLNQCRYCKVRDIDPSKKDTYIMPSQGWYYHINCYEKKLNEGKSSKPKDTRQCIYCKKYIDINKEEYMMPRNRKYAHKSCYEKYYTPDEGYIDKIYKLLKEEVGISYDYQVCERQRNSYLKMGYTNEGIYNALKYHYIVKNGSIEKSGNRIGIVPYVYNEAESYYKNLHKRQQEMSKGLQHQLETKVKEVIINNSDSKGRKKYIDLDTIESDDEVVV